MISLSIAFFWDIIHALLPLVIHGIKPWVSFIFDRGSTRVRRTSFYYEFNDLFLVEDFWDLKWPQNCLLLI